MLQAAESLGRGAALVELESRVVCRDGSLRWVEWSTRVIPEEGLFYAAGRDVTESRRAAEEQAALRRVATLVARRPARRRVRRRGAGGRRGARRRRDAPRRFDRDGTVVSVAQWGRYPGVALGARYPLEGDSVSARVLRTGRPARMDDYGDAPGVIAETVAADRHPLLHRRPDLRRGPDMGRDDRFVEGAEPFPAETESRLQDFTELVATAIANASAHARSASWRTSRRRCAASPRSSRSSRRRRRCSGRSPRRSAGCSAVDSVVMVRYEEDRSRSSSPAAGSVAAALPIGTRVPLEGRNVASLVFRTARRAARRLRRAASGPVAERLTTAGVRSVVGTPIMVEGRLWGAMLPPPTTRLLPPDTEARIGQFTELMATAIANAEARAEVARLADEQAALRRVATLVAQGARPSAVFDAVTHEVAELLDASAVSLARYDDDMLTVVASAGAGYVRVGERFPLGGTNVDVDRAAHGTAPRAWMTTRRRPDGSATSRARRRPVGGRRARHRRRPHLGRARRDLGGPRAAARRHRGADGQLRRAARHRDRQR